MSEKEAEDAIILMLREWVQDTAGVRGHAVVARKIVAMVRQHGVTTPRPIAATHNPDGDSLVLTFRNDEDLEIAMKELGCELR